MSPEYLQNKSCMDGSLMNLLHGNLHLLSNKSLKTLVSYYEKGTLSLRDQGLLRNEITQHLDMSKVPPLQD